jgi:hypothetical protein
LAPSAAGAISIACALAVGCSSCGEGYSFVCSSDLSCGAGGICIGGGCAFADSTCASGRRFDKSADRGRAAQCTDASPPPDLAGATTCTPIGATEDCFNGLDDDCNGHIDCDDSACTAIAQCIEDAHGWRIGTEVAPSTACPLHYAHSQTDLHQGMGAGGACGGCTCAPSLDCHTTLYELGNPSDCNNSKPSILSSWQVTAGSCQASVGGMGLGIVSGAVQVDPFAPSPQCTGGGSPTVPTITWQASTRFCEVAQIGGGCPAGNICVPKVTSRRCVMASGAQSCPPNYAPEGSPGESWYTGVGDGRTCGSICTCSVAATPTPDCGAYTILALAANLGCNIPATGLAPGSTCNLGSTTYQSAKIVLQGATLPGCSVSNAVSGVATPSGASALCCL